MTRHKGVMDALFWVGETGNAIQLPQLGKALPAAGQQFMGIALMTDIKHDLVFRRFQYAVQCNGQLYRTEVGGEMSTCFGNMIQQKCPDLFTQLIDLPARKLFQIARL